MLKPGLTAVIFIFWATGPAVPIAQAYKANCSTSQVVGNPFIATQINSEFSEARPATQGVVTPTRFHGGIDIGDTCSENNFVRPIEAGVIYTTSTACESATVCTRVVAPSGHAFDYEHVVWNTFITNGQSVDTTTVIGKIDLKTNGGNHLHLNEVIKTGSVNTRVNPQLPNRLEYSDSDTPQFSTATVGSVVDQPIIFIHGGSESSPVEFLLRNGYFYVSGGVDILATANFHDNTGKAKRKGVYSVATDAVPVARGGFLIYSRGTNLPFDFLQDGASVVGDVQSVYYQRQVIADTYLPMSQFTGPNTPQAQYGAWATAFIPDQVTSVCATVQDHPQPGQHPAQQCVNTYVDNTAPSTPTFTSAGAAFTVATATPIITVTATDSGGIYSIKIDNGVSYSSTNYPSGVQTAASNQFPNSSTLPNGTYAVTVVDLAGNVNSNSCFMVGTTRFLVESAA
jgi:hypothetical protein